MVYTYFSHYPNDFWLHKVAVITAVISDTLTVFANAVSMYLYLISHFGDEVYATTQPWPIVSFTPWLQGAPRESIQAGRLDP